MEANVSQDDSTLQNNWICPKCLAQNQKSSLVCNCGLAVNNDDLSEYSGTITVEELYKEIDNYAFIAADRKVFILRCYLLKRFPASSEAQKIKQKIDITSETINRFHEALDSCVSKKEVTCGKCGTVNVYKSQTQQCSTCGDWLYQYMSPQKEDIPSEDYAPNNYDPSAIHCPKCHSTQVTAQKQGFGLGKAAVGGVLTGGVGLLGGFIGSRKIYLTCLKCGHRFNPGA
jgi:DNA-directed RNA polymerase subunit M/transcription elongation factor TFIIS